jgi:hypothetical protein
VAVDPLDEDVEHAAAGQPDSKGLVVADPVALEHRAVPVEHIAAEFVQLTLHTAA